MKGPPGGAANRSTRLSVCRRRLWLRPPTRAITSPLRSTGKNSTVSAEKRRVLPGRLTAGGHAAGTGSWLPPERKTGIFAASSRSSSSRKRIRPESEGLSRSKMSPAITRKSTSSRSARSTIRANAANGASARRPASSGRSRPSPRNALPRCRSAQWMNFTAAAKAPPFLRAADYCSRGSRFSMTPAVSTGVLPM